MDSRIIIIIVIGVVALFGVVAALSFQEFEPAATSPVVASNVTSSPCPDNDIVDIAIVKHSFTVSAYQTGGFYEFYSKYGYEDPTRYQEINTDLDKLTVPYKNEAYHEYTKPWFSEHLVSILAPSDVRIIYDRDVHNGALFSDNCANFDVVILGHAEYMTQQMYDALRTFTHGGGTLVILDGNAFYAEVSYNANANTMQLVKGHSWEFNGTLAKTSVDERWLDENREWIGSNFWVVRGNTGITFGNNPFNYTHHEENYITNPAAVVLLDYQANDPDHQIATYRMSYGDGVVLHMGIFAEKVILNPDFLEFFDAVLLDTLDRPAEV